MSIYGRIWSALGVLTGKKPPGHDIWYGHDRGVSTTAGINISEETAIQVLTVFACVSKIAKTVASLPVHVYEKAGERGRKAVDHPLNEILGGMANTIATGLTVRETLLTNLLLWGNAYAEILRVGDVVVGLVPIQSSRVSPQWDDSGTRLVFEVLQDSGPPIVMQPEDVLHVPGLSLNGVVGMSVIGAHRESLGLTQAATTFGSSFFGNGAQPGGFLNFAKDCGLSDEQMDLLVQRFNEQFQGTKRAHRVGRLHDGVTFSQLGMPLDDMQFLELRKFQRIEICGLFDVPPAMIQEHDPGKYTTTEQQSITWARDSLLPWCIRFEQAMAGKFLPRGGRLYIKHNLAGLQRGDMKTRYESYALGRAHGWLSANDVRELEDMNPVDGGDDYSSAGKIPSRDLATR